MPTEKRSQEASPSPTLSSTLVAQLREAIMRGDFIPGAKLPLDKMRVTFGVSLSPLREALCRLESEGLVQIEDQRGYFVAPVSPENLAEVIRLRVELEGMALRDAMAHGDTAWEGRILAILHQLKTSRRETVEEKTLWEACHRDFHAELISASQMPMLRQFCAMLHDQSDRYRRIFLAVHAPDRDTATEHTAIAGAVISRRTEDAIALMRDHIERTGRNIQAALCNA
jgi:GntR family transcriptional regulator, carbon starvation induced regulator